MSSDFQFIKYEEKDATAIILINRPEVYNALTADAKFEIIRAVRQANKSSTIRSIILTGEGKAFCTGQDLNDRTIQSDQGPVDLGNTLETEWNPLIKSLRDSKKIVIAAINGVCAGAGLSIALACDLIVSKPSVKFISGFSKLGLAPDAGSTFAMTKALGYQRTLDFFLFNSPLTAEQLLEAGLINEVSEEFLDKAIAKSEAINRLAPLSVEMIKNNAKFALESTFEESIKKETYTQRFLGNSADYQEGLKAFFEKRDPNFGGH